MDAASETFDTPPVSAMVGVGRYVDVHKHPIGSAKTEKGQREKVPRATPTGVRLGDKLDLLHAACAEAGDYQNGSAPVGLEAAGWRVRLSNDQEREGEVLAYHEPSDTYSVRFEGDVSSFHKNADLQFLSPPTEECLRARGHVSETIEEAEMRLGSGTIKSACFKVLKQAAPAGLALTDIVHVTQKQGLKDWGTVKQPANTVNAILSMDTAFVRTAPGRFALRGMEATVSMGQTVLRHFPEDGEWLEASVADYDEISRQHRLVYHLNTTEETFEWLQLAALGPDLLRFPSKNPASNATMYQCDSCQRSFDSLGGLRMHSARWCPNLPQNQTQPAAPTKREREQNNADIGWDSRWFVTTKNDRKERNRDSKQSGDGSQEGGDENRDGADGEGGHFECHMCARVFDSSGGLRMHNSRWCPLREGAAKEKQELAEGLEPENFLCPYCSKRFPSAGGLRMHASRWCSLRPQSASAVEGGEQYAVY